MKFPELILLVEPRESSAAICVGVVVDGVLREDVEGIDVSGEPGVLTVRVHHRYFPGVLQTMTREQWERLQVARSLNLADQR